MTKTQALFKQLLPSHNYCRQRCCGKVMFSVMSVSPSVQGDPHTEPWLQPCNPYRIRTPLTTIYVQTWTSQYRDPPNIFKLVHYAARSSVSKRAVGFWLKCLLVLICSHRTISHCPIFRIQLVYLNQIQKVTGQLSFICFNVHFDLLDQKINERCLDWQIQRMIKFP